MKWGMAAPLPCRVAFSDASSDGIPILDMWSLGAVAVIAVDVDVVVVFVALASICSIPKGVQCSS